MRLIITKPEDGEVTITVEDRRGATGKNWREKNVPVGQAEVVAGAMVGVWEEKRKAIKDARKPPLA